MTLGKFYQIVPILFGLGTLIYQQTNLEEFLPGLYDPKETYLGVSGVDNVLNILVPFYRQYLNDSSSLLLNHSVFPLFSVLLFIIAVEASIPGVKGLIGHYALMAALSQLLGASVAIPLIWIPAWIASENRKENSLPTKNVTLNPKRIEKIGLGILLITPSLVCMMVFKQKILLDWSIIIFQFSPPLVAIFWAWYPKEVESSSVTLVNDAYRIACKYSSILFGISLFEWLLVLTYAIDNNFEILFDTLGQLISGITLPATVFMMIDTWGLIAAATYWVFLAEKANLNKTFWKFIGQSILFGSSGALALYAYHRYYELMKDDDDDTKRNSPNNRLRYTNSNEPNETQPLL